MPRKRKSSEDTTPGVVTVRADGTTVNSRGRWVPGTKSPNVAGRPYKEVEVENRQIWDDAATPEEKRMIARSFVDDALGGDKVARRECADRWWPIQGKLSVAVSRDDVPATDDEAQQIIDDVTKFLREGSDSASRTA